MLKSVSMEYLPKAHNNERSIQRETVTASADNDYIMELYDVIDSDNDDDTGRKRRANEQSKKQTKPKQKEAQACKHFIESTYSALPLLFQRINNPQISR